MANDDEKTRRRKAKEAELLRYIETSEREWQRLNERMRRADAAVR